MRRVRSRLTILLYLLIIGSSLTSLLLAALTRNGIIFQRDSVRFLLFGFAAKDVVLLLTTLAIMVLAVTLTSRSTTNPIRDLTRATKEIAAGNYNVQVDIRDRVEEFGELQRNFNLMAAELRSNEYLRKDFISNVSHELKTPLSIIGGYAKLLSEGGLPETEQQEYARLIAREADRLTALSGNMLRLSRMDSQQMPLHMEIFPLGEQLRQAILQLEPRRAAAGLTLEADIPDLDCRGDPELLFQLWTNLLDNAIKFTPTGGTISVTLSRAEGHLAVEVADTGVGMDREALSRIFEQFYQAESDRKGEGSGLGLALSKRIAELHGGSVSVQSTPGQGSVFTVTLPA